MCARVAIQEYGSLYHCIPLPLVLILKLHIAKGENLQRVRACSNREFGSQDNNLMRLLTGKIRPSPQVPKVRQNKPSVPGVHSSAGSRNAREVSIKINGLTYRSDLAEDADPVDSKLLVSQDPRNVMVAYVRSKNRSIEFFCTNALPPK